MKSILFTLFLLTAAMAGRAQQSPEQIIANFFVEYESQPPAVALENLYANMPWVERIREDVEDLKTDFSGLPGYVGSYIGHDLMAQKEVAGRFSIYSYLVRFDRQPIRFVFQFYKPQDTWGLYSFSYDDGFPDELEESMELHMLKLE